MEIFAAFHKIFKTWPLFLLLLTWIKCNVVQLHIIDYSENTELIQQKAGWDVKLQCNLEGIISVKELSNIKIHWFFKQCIDDDDESGNCHNSVKHDWTELPCAESFCKPDLVLRNVTEKYSGLYKCTVYPYPYPLDVVDNTYAPKIQFVRTYQLEVKNNSSELPEFLDSYPSNKTAIIGTQVVFQCKAYSEAHLSIKWFRRLSDLRGDQMQQRHLANDDNSNNIPHNIVHYNGHFYEILTNAPEKLISHGVYLSKLIMNGVRLQDEGFYACLALNYQGHKIREAYLKVNAENDVEYWSDYTEESQHTDPSEFWLLFLMPLGLAMMPVVVWLCYVTFKKYKFINEIKGDNPRLDEESAPDHCMLRV